jgi:hypothetical protein
MKCIMFIKSNTKKANVVAQLARTTTDLLLGFRDKHLARALSAIIAVKPTRKLSRVRGQSTPLNGL